MGIVFINPIHPKEKTMKRFLIVLLACFLIILCSSILAQNKRMNKRNIILTRGPFHIDVHNHLFGGKGLNEKAFAQALKVAAQTMENLRISKMILMPPPLQYGGNKNKYDIDLLKNIIKKYPGKFALIGGGGTLNVLIQEAIHKGKVTKKMKKDFKDHAASLIKLGAVGFGEMSIDHFCLGDKHNYHYSPPDHPLFLLLADLAAKYDVPIDVHMEAVPVDMQMPERLQKFEKNPKILKANIPAFEKLLKHNPKAKIIWSHIGWGNTGKRDVNLTRALLKKHPNLYMSFKICYQDAFESNRPIEKQTNNVKPEWIALIKEFPDRFFLGQIISLYHQNQKGNFHQALKQQKSFIYHSPKI